MGARQIHSYSFSVNNYLHNFINPGTGWRADYDEHSPHLLRINRVTSVPFDFDQRFPIEMLKVANIAFEIVWYYDPDTYR